MRMKSASMCSLYFVGVDPSLSNTGCVILGSTGQVVDVCNARTALKGWTGKGKKLDSSQRAQPQHQIERLRLVSACLQGFIRANTPQDAIVHAGYEDYSYQSLNRSFALGELGGVLKKALLFGLDRQVGSLTLVAPTLLKQFAVGAGTAEKEEVISQAKEESTFIKRLTPSVCTDDVCDAYFLAKFAWYKCARQGVVEEETSRDFLRNRLEISMGGI